MRSLDVRIGNSHVVESLGFLRHVRREVLVGWALIALVALLAGGPVAYVIYTSFQVATPGDVPRFGLDGWRRVFQDAALVEAAVNTVVLAAASVMISSPLAILFAWVTTRTDTPFRELLSSLIRVGFAIPVMSQTLGWILLLDPDYGLVNRAIASLPFLQGFAFNIYSYGGILWAHVGFATAVRFMLIEGAFRRFDATLEEAAMVSGCGGAKVIWKVTAPLLAPSILAAMSLGFIKAIESFEVELMLGVPAGIYVYSTRVYELVNKWDGPDFAGASALSTGFIGVIGMLIVLYNYLISGRSFVTVTGKGYSARPVRLGKWKWVTFGLVVGYFVAVILVPAVVTVLGSFMRLFGFFDIPSPYTLEHWRVALSDTMFLLALKNTVLVGVLAALGGDSGLHVRELRAGSHITSGPLASGRRQLAPLGCTGHFIGAWAPVDVPEQWGAAWLVRVRLGLGHSPDH